MAGFRTTQQQQLWRRILRAVPLRILTYLVALLGWWLGPVEPATLLEPLRQDLLWVLAIVHITAIEFGMATFTEGTWPGPRWGRRRRSLRRRLLPMCVVGYAGLAGLAASWSAVMEQPLPLIGVQAAVALIWFGTLRRTLLQPVEARPAPERFARDQLQFMTSLAKRGQRIESESEMRTAVLATLVDLPDNQAARLLAWQLALKSGDFEDALHHVEHLERLDFETRDLLEMKALCAMGIGRPGEAADALERRVEIIRESPRQSPAGQRADFVAILHLAFALLRAARWRRAATCLDDLAADFETAPFVGVLDRLIVNHMRWRSACALESAELAQTLERRCRRFGRRTVRRAERRLLRDEGSGATPEAVRWWQAIAREALDWWRENARL